MGGAQGGVLNEDQGSPNSLDLPQGINAEKLAQAVRASGYPLQTVVARQLNDSFEVVEEWGYVDRTTQEHRSLDVFAHRRLTATSRQLEPSLALLVECKRSDLPYVFFAAAIPRTPAGLPSIVGLPKSKFDLYQEPNRFREVPAAEFLRCSDFLFVSDGPVSAATFSRVERKGKDLCLSGTVPYNSVILPLASALEHYQETRKAVSAHQECFYPTLALCVCVIDAPLVVAGGTPESPELRTVSWIRLAHEEALQEGTWWRRKHYFVDAVRREFLAEFLDKHLIPFAEQVASRMVGRDDLVIAGKGMVRDWDDWSWGEMRPVNS